MSFMANLKLDTFMNSKTVHSTSAIKAELVAIAESDSFTNREAHQDFTQKAQNFEIVCERTGRTSWGRNQFLEFWCHGTVGGVNPFRSSQYAQTLQEKFTPPPRLRPEEPIPFRYSTVRALLEQIDYCGFECQGGPLTLNAAYIELKRRLLILTEGDAL